ARVDEALGEAATYGRFATGDLVSFLEAGVSGPARRADESTSLAQGTAGWAAIGQASAALTGSGENGSEDRA
ncbi:IS21 family transposase, partial [Gulosibacter molinativorax]|nr:IS21 family transposase [Gulosibacter molinativorax]